MQSRVRPWAPWFDSDCRALRRQCRKLERRYRRSKSEPDRAAYFEALRNKHAEFAAKKNCYWDERISAEEGCPAKLWRSLARILRRDDDSPGANAHNADSFITFFDNKVKGVRASTADASPATSTRRASSTFADFRVISEDDVWHVVMSSPTKSCTFDPISKDLPKEMVDMLLSYLTAMINASLREGHLPASQKLAIITPLL